ncbi:AsmA family protein [Aminobacter anthyllidis]|uniref:AsmA family protein n=1 Tax=Aminobacter anthyllidis TaxID=1035067 RepID=UPI0024568182|nr:AsmA family protein [Aminobacter anthyllidis]MDH4986049.1 AsmA family protein [Aminobacter anthyllidis]
MPSPLFRRSIWAIIGLIVLVAATVAAVPFIASTQIVKDRIAFEMSAWSGFRVSIEGTPDIEIWPVFRATLTDVTLTDWDDEQGSPVIEAERVEIELSALSALSGNVDFSDAHFIRPTLRLKRLADGGVEMPHSSGGRLSRAIERARATVASNPVEPDLSALPADEFGAVEFIDGRVVAVSDEGEDELLSDLTGKASLPALNKAGKLTATGVWHGEQVALELSSPSPLMLFAGGTAPIVASLKSAPLEASFDGTIDMGPDAHIDGQAKVVSPSFRRMLEWSRPGILPGSPVGSISLASKVTGNLSRLKIENAQVTLDGNPGMGILDLSLDGAVPSISGTLAFDTLDLMTFASSFASIAPSTNAGTADIDTSFSDRINLDLRLSATKATAGSIALAEVAATAQVKGGLAAFDISDAEAFGGNVQASIRFDRKPGGNQAEMRLLASDIDGGAFGTAAGMSHIVPIGRGTVSVILQGPGSNWNTLLENANGSVAATFGVGAIAGLDLQAFMKRAAERGFFSLDEVSGGTLPVDGVELKATISNGVAKIDKAEARTPTSRIWLTGIVPYVGRGLALSGAIEAREVTASTSTTTSPVTPAVPPTAFFVGGSWSAPFISPLVAPVISSPTGD